MRKSVGEYRRIAMQIRNATPGNFTGGVARFPNRNFSDRECAKEKSQLDAGFSWW